MSNLTNRSNLTQVQGRTDQYVSTPTLVGPSWKQLSISDGHTLAIRSNDTLWAWGNNSTGQLGDGTLASKNSPVQIGISYWNSISAGSTHSMAIRKDGLMFAWGQNSTGQVGNNGVPYSNVWKQVSSLTGHTLLIRSDDTLWAVGTNTYGELGDGTVTTRLSPVQIGTSKYIAISAGVNHSTAITKDNRLFIWGFNTNGELGQNDTVFRSSPVQIAGSWTQVSCTAYNATQFTATGAINTQGQLWMWGNNGSGTLGDGTTVNRSSPVQIGAGSLSFTMVSIGLNNTSAIGSDGTLWSWGNNPTGQLGTGDTIARSSPVQVGLLTNWSQVSRGWSHAAALTTGGAVYTWGYNAAGQLGDGTAVNKSSPTLVLSSGVRTIVAHSMSTTAAISTDNKLLIWGGNSVGELGDGTVTNKSAPVQIGNDTNWNSISLGNGALGLKTDNSLFGWGRDSNYQTFFGINGGTAGGYRSSPVQTGAELTVVSPVQIGTSSWTQVSAGTDHSLAIRSDSTLWSFGNNNLGQLLITGTTSTFSPIQVNTSSYSQISAGKSFSLAIATDGTLYSGGNNNAGQAGQPTLSAIYSWSQIVSGPQHTLAIRTDGLLFTWGQNTYGQLGLGDNINRSSPTQLGTNSWISIAANSLSTDSLGFSLAVRADGTVWSWGSNTNGRLGDNSTIDRSSPVQVGSIAGMTKVAAGQLHGVAAGSNGLWTWGYNGTGQLGDTSTIQRSSPVQISTFSFTQLASGYQQNAAIRSDGIMFTWGQNISGELGTNDTINRSVITQVGTSSWTQVFTRLGPVPSNDGSTWAIRADGKLFAFGNNSSYALGDSTLTNRSSPVQIGTATWVNIRSATDAVAGAVTTFGLKTDGSLWAWGVKNNSMGIDSATATFTHSWTQLSAGISHTMFIRGDNTLWGTGANTSGQVGDNSVVNRSSPVQVGTSAWNKVSAGGQFTLALDSNNLLWSWGVNNAGQLGLGGNDAKSSPLLVNSMSWSQISAGLSHALAIDNTGSIYSWGSNSYKQLGQYTSQYANALSWSSISAGVNFSLFIRSDGKLFGTGINTYGSIGDNTTVNKSSPVQIGTNSWNSAIALFGSSDYSLALRSDGTLWSWGYNATGQLGLNDLTDRSSPVQIGTSSWTSVAGGGFVTFALRADNTLWAWGTNNNGIFGIPTTYVVYSSPVQVSTKLYSKISTRNENTGGAVTFSLGIDTLGKLYAWGSNSTGQLGQGATIIPSWSYVATGNDNNMFAIDTGGALWGWGTSSAATLQAIDGTTAKSSPVQIGFADSLTEYPVFSKVAPGFQHGYAISTTGALYGWGQQPANSNAVAYTEPFLPLLSPYSWSQISAGLSYNLAIRSDSKLFGWGLGTSGQLGDSTLISKSAPVQIGNSSWLQVAAGNTTSAGIDITGRLFTWGYGANGELGDNTVVSKSSPVLVSTAYSWSNVSVGLSDIFAIRADGLLFGWGGNTTGSLGQNDTVKRSSPVQVSSRKFTKVISGTNGSAINYMMAIRDDNLLFAVGKNSGGQLGLGDTIDRSSPVQVGTSSWSSISNAGGAVAAIDTNGKLFTWGGTSFVQLGTNKSWVFAAAASAIDYLGRLWIWGDATFGKLGDNSTVFKSSPVQIGLGNSWSQVGIGATHGAALDSNGALWTWGYNASGQLGSNNTINRSSPVQISADIYTKIRVGQAQNAAINQQGQLFIWGGNSFGIMGDSTTTNKSVPVQIGIGYSWADVHIGTSTAIALRGDNTLWVWGRNESGQLGQNNTIDRSSPVQVPGSWSQIAMAGIGSLLAIKTDSTMWAWGWNNYGQLGQNDTISRSSPVQVSAGYPGAVVLTGSSSSVSTTNINFGTGLFTVEGWFYRTSAVGTNTTFWGSTNGTGVTPKIIFNQMNTGELRVYHTAGDATLTNSTTLVPQNTWVHIAVVRDAVAPAGIKIYVNGQLQSSTTNASSDYSGITGTFNIGADGESAYAFFPGSISNFRVVTGVAVYTGNFSVSKSPLQITQSAGTNISAITQYQTQLLVASNAPNLYDASLSHRPLTLTNATYSANSPISHSFSQIVGTYLSLYAKSATDNTLWGWGFNGQGQIADGTTVDKSSPTQISSFSSYITNLNSHRFIEHPTMWSSMGLLSNNDLHLWGGNSLGDLGDGTTVSKSSPVQVGADLYRSSPVQVGSMSWSAISGGGNFFLGIANNSLYGWGYNTVGQLGTGDRTSRAVPTLLRSQGYSQLSTSSFGYHAGMIDSNGKLFTVGANDTGGQLGFSSTVSRSSPVQVPAFGVLPMTKFLTGSSFTQVSTYLHTAAIKTDSTLWMWGYNAFGQVGDGTTVTKDSPVQVAGSWSQVSINEYTTFGLKTDGTLWGWGSNVYGQFADNSTIHRSIPVQITTSSYIQIAANSNSVYVIKPDYTLWAWGYNVDGQLGDNTTVNKSSPVQISATDANASWTQLSAAGTTLLLQAVNGKLYATGMNTSGQLGDSTLVSRSKPVQLTGIGASSSVFVLPANSAYSYGAAAKAAISNGMLYTWGQGPLGQLGDNTNITKSIPTLITGTRTWLQSPTQIGTSSWLAVSAGDGHVAAITTDNKMFTWGNNSAGQLGRLTDYLSISTSSNTNQDTQGYNMYVKGDGALFGVGSNNGGQLGDGTTVSKSSPVQIGATGDWKIVSAGAGAANGWTLAMKQNGTLWAWGNNSWSQTGDGTVTSTSSPIVVGGAGGVGTYNNWVSIAASYQRGFAVNSIGELYSWGNDNVNPYQSFPTKIGTASNWKKVFAGTWSRHAFILKNDNTLWGWGSNLAGRLGVGDTIDRTSPTQVPGSWIMASIGGSSGAEGPTSYGIKTDYTMWGWGDNTGGVGEVGDGSGISRSSPVQIGASQATSWLAVFGILQGAQALASDGTLWYWTRTLNANGITDWTGIANYPRATPTLLSKDVVFQDYTEWDRYRLGRIWPTQQGQLYVWGPNNTGLLGQGDTISRSSPVQLGSTLPVATYILDQLQGSWLQVTAGTSNTVATRTDGTLWAWGLNNAGQVGDNTTQSRSSPTQIGNNYWTTISTSADHSAAIKLDGSLWVWGKNAYGQLGFSDTVSRSSPVQLGTSSWTQVYANSRGTLAIDSTGRLFTWGRNSNGQLGLNDTISRSSPVQVGALTTWSQIFAGAEAPGNFTEYSLGINTLGQLFTWGYNGNGQLGDNTTVAKSSPVQIMTTSSFTFVSAKTSHIMALDIAKKLYVFGGNTAGQLGLGDTADRSSPTQVGTGLWTNIAAGTITSAAIDMYGSLYTWGDAGNGILGDATSAARSSPVQVGTSTWAAIYSLGKGFAAVKPGYNRNLYGWGFNAYGQLGNGTVTNLSVPTLVNSIVGWTNVVGTFDSGQLYSTLGIKDGKLFAWGNNIEGSLGDGTTISRSSPVQIGTTTSWTVLASQGSHTSLIRSDSALFGTGLNTSGQLGDNSLTTRSSLTLVGSSYITLNAVPTKLDNNSYSQVYAGEYHSMALKPDNTLWGWGLDSFNAITNNNTSKWSKIYGGGYYGGLIDTFGGLYLWGLNTSGQLGDSTVTTRPGPRKLDNNSWSMVAFGLSYTAAIRADGTLWTWGQNTYGNLGNSTTIDRSSPVQLGSSSNWTGVAAGYYTTTALNSLGQLFTWGYNPSGQLGDLTTVNKSSPVQIPGSWSNLASAGPDSQTFGAFKADTTLYIWGQGGAGVAGDNSVNAKSSPTQISGSWTQAAIAGTALAIRVDGTLWGWGSSTYGELGQTSTVSRSSPVQITVYNYKQVGVGSQHVIALRSDDTAWTWGLNNNGQLGLNDLTYRSSPTQIGTSKYTFVSAMNIGSRLLAYDNTVSGSGQYPGNETVTGTSSFVFVDTSYTQIAANPLSFVSSPTQIGTNSWTSVSTNFKHTLAIKPDGTMWGWGGNSEGQLGYITPAIVNSIAVNAYIKGDGTLWAWGANSATYPRVGDNTTVNRSSPVQILTGGNNGAWSKVISTLNNQSVNGEGQSLAIDTSGRLWTWGYNNQGQLGDSTLTSRPLPFQIGHTRWSKLATPYAIKEDGTLWGWGQNGIGQVGDTSTINRSSPVQIGTSSWAAVGSNTVSGHAIRLDGSLWAWGDNTSGALGDSTTVNKSSPIQIGALLNWRTLAPSGSAAINNLGQLFMWGYNGNGSMGDNSTVSRSSPVQVMTTTSCVSVSTYSSNNLTEYTLVIDTLGKMYSMGNNNYGRLGDSTSPNNSRSSPVQIGTGNSWLQVAAGPWNAYAIRIDGTLWTWGDGGLGGIGDGTTISRSSPVQVGTETWQAVYAGVGGAYGVRNNQMYVWGYNIAGQLGLGDTISRSSPVLLGSSFSVVSDALGYGNTMALKSTGELFALGGPNANGYLALNDTIARSSPVQVGTSGMSWTSIATGLGISAAIKNDNTLWLWGNNTYGALGNGNTVSRSNPVQLVGSWNMVAVNGQNTQTYAFGIRADKTLWAWGWDAVGISGLNTNGVNRSSPVQIGTSSWNIVSTGSYYGAGGIDIDGRLFMWGSLPNGYGVGDNTNAYRSSPVQIMAGRSFTQLSVGDSFAAAIDTTGTLWTWGQNGLGELGVNDVIPRSSPVQVGTSSWMMVSATGATMFAVLDTGSQKVLYGWGNNSAYGLLGDGTTVNKSSPVQLSTFTTTRLDIFYSSPVQIGVGSSWLQVATGPYHSVALKNDYTVWTWGMGIAGQLGNNEIIYRSSPIQIGTSSYTAIYAGADAQAYGQTFASGITGLLFAWGQNNFGQLGDNSTVLRSAPLQIATATMGTSPIYPINLTTTRGTSFSQIGYGPSYVTAIKSDGTLYTWGLNNNGQLGQNATSTQYSLSPAKIGGTSTTYSLGTNTIGTNSWSQVSAGASHALAIDTSGRLFGWGNYAGNMSTISKSWRMIRTDNTIIGIKYDGTLWTWGYNAYGQLGDSTTISRSSPVQVGADTNWASVTAGPESVAAIKTDGTLWAWGRNAYGNFGNGTNISTSSPVQVPGTWKQVNMGLYSTTGQQTDGTWWIWGQNTYGTLGNNTIISKSSPVQLQGNWNSVITSSDAAVAVATDGMLWVWGINTYGQLGLGDTIHRSNPVQLGNSVWKTAMPGGLFSLALRSDGTIWASGDNSSGTLGDGTGTFRSSPVQIGAGIIWSNITTNSFSGAKIALDITGNLYGWGINNNGQAGVNIVATYITSPVAVGSGIKFASVNGGLTPIAIDTNNNLYTWGYNGYGTIDDSLVSKSSPILLTTGIDIGSNSPVQVTSGSWSQIDAGTNTNLAVDSNNVMYFWGKNDAHQSGIVGNTSPYVIAPTRLLISQPASNGISTGATGAGAIFKETVKSVPDAPAITSTNASGRTTATVTFTPPGNNGGDIITSYTIISTPDNITVTTTTAGVASITGLTPNTAYTFTVYANNSLGNGKVATSNQITTWEYPGAPVVGTATVTSDPVLSGTTANVSFTAPSCNGNTPVVSYTAVSNPGNITKTVYQSGSGSITVSGLTALTSYTFTVYATTAAGNSVSSSASNSITTTDYYTGQTQYTTAGTYSWTVPAGVYSVSVVGVGGGGGFNVSGAYRYSGGSGGGALVYGNNLAVTPGEVISLQVGNGYNPNNNTPAEPTWFRNATYLYAGAGQQQAATGATTTFTPGCAGGGGGAGGYLGDGAPGASAPDAQSYAPGAGGISSGTARSGGGNGGAGGYGGSYSLDTVPPATSSQLPPTGSGAGAGGGRGGVANGLYRGGGVGVFGLGNDGNITTNLDGSTSIGDGASFGAGSEGHYVYNSSFRSGAIRIIWPGISRQFPSTRTTDL